VYYCVTVLQQLLRIATPLLAVLTATYIYLMVPYFANMPSPCQLQQLNQELQEHKENLHKEVAQRTHELMQEQAKWKMVAEQSPQILWLKNTQGSIEYYNNKWCVECVVLVSINLTCV
jgi:C4-dicarboxylate-specific signal transduction histidine kinase